MACIRRGQTRAAIRRVAHGRATEWALILVVVAAAAGSAHATIDVAPQTLLFGSSVLEPNLHDTHVESRIGAEPLPDVPGRLGRTLVGPLECVQLFGRDCRPGPLIARFTQTLPSPLVIGLANQLVVLHQIEFIARIQLALTNETLETVQMVIVVLGAANLRIGRYAQLTVATSDLRKLPVEVVPAIGPVVAQVTLLAQWTVALGANETRGVPVLVVLFLRLLDARCRCSSSCCCCHVGCLVVCACLVVLVEGVRVC